MAKKVAINEEDLIAMPRSKVRYALYRCKNGNPDKDHIKIYNYYLNEISEDLGMDEMDFAEPDGWDIHKKDVTNVITGKLVRKYIDELHAPATAPK